MGGEVAQVDEGYADFRLARLYDAESPWHPQDDFYLSLDMQAGSVLDVGCGTGTRLVRARQVGHPGQLVGVDPAPGMLAVARAKSDQVEWIHGDAQTLSLGRRFDLATMTGHAFQVLLDDEAVRAALRTFPPAPDAQRVAWPSRPAIPRPGPGSPGQPLGPAGRSRLPTVSRTRSGWVTPTPTGVTW